MKMMWEYLLWCDFGAGMPLQQGGVALRGYDRRTKAPTKQNDKRTAKKKLLHKAMFEEFRYRQNCNARVV